MTEEGIEIKAGRLWKKIRKRIFRWLLVAAGSLALLISAVFLLVYAGAFGSLATVEDLQHIQNYQSSEVYSNDRVMLGKYYFQDRTDVLYRDLPAHLIDALIATEDIRFYQHSGIDARSAFRVLVKTLLLGDESSGGGSTLQQQLAKNLYPRKHFSILTMPVNKFREMILAVRLSKAYSKKEILELYLNTVSFGENTYGIETAANRFFNTSPRNLKTEEAALLVGMLKGTYYYNPRHFPERSVERRNLVLSQMFTYGFISRDTKDSLCLLPLTLDYVHLTHNEGLAPYFREHLRMTLLEWAENHPREDGTKYNIYTDGLKIYTTLNADLQRFAEESVRARMAYLQGLFDRQWKNRDPFGPNNDYIIDQLKQTPKYRSLRKEGLSEKQTLEALRTAGKMDIFTWDGMKEAELSSYDSVVHYAKFLHAGLLSVEAKTGYIRAWVGGIHSEYFKYDHVTSRRQAGSTFKPILYAAALERGYQPCWFVENDSVVYEEYDNWTPRNSHGGYGGWYSLKGALAHSVNTVSVKLMESLGIRETIRFARKMGIEGEMPEVLSLALGTGSVSLQEMVRAYSVFLNEGQMIEPIFLRRIEDKNGKVLFEAEPGVPERILDAYDARMMTEIMKGTVDRGTARSLRSVYGFDNEMAGKTGTTQRNTDGWYIGYTPLLVTGVWVGGDLPRVRFRWGGYGQGAYAALPIWARYMQKIYRDPLYRNSKDLSFGIPEYISEELDCDDHRLRVRRKFRMDN
jgi:penicillin-binding protein 1A